MKRVFIVLLIILIGSVVYSFGISSYENVKVNQIIADFKNRAVLDEEKTIDPEVRRYYKVISEDVLDEETYIENNEKFYLGNIGDIVVTRESPFPKTPFIHQFISYYFGGHAAVISDVNEVIEIAGFPDSDENMLQYIFHNVKYDDEGNSNHNFTGATIIKDNNYFLNKYSFSGDYGYYYRNKLITLRVKAPIEDRRQAVLEFEELLRKKVIYNYMFFLDTKEKYYCTDLMSRTYQSLKDENGKSKYNLNDDGFITSVNDLILAKDTYIINYFEVDKNGVEHIYYLTNDEWNQG